MTGTFAFPRRQHKAYVVMTAVLAAHVTAAVLLAALIGRVNGEIWLLATTAVPVIGVFNASYGLLIAWAVLVRRRRWAWRLPIALVLAGLLAWSEGPVLGALCQSNGSVGVLGWIGWSAFQVFYLSASLVFIAISRRDLA